MTRVRFGDPLPRSWLYATVVLSVSIAAAVSGLGGPITPGSLLVGVVIGLAVGFEPRIVHKQTHK